MANPVCSIHGWSILHSAPTNSGLAGVLAGFAFTAGVIYVGRSNQLPRDIETDPEIAARHAAARSLQDVQTISLFTASFIILGLNSFVWGVVAGSRALVDLGPSGIADAPETCSRAWSQAIIAVGMLSLGAIAMVCNITSVFLWQQSLLLADDDRRYLRSFLLIVTAIAVLGVIAFVGSDAMSFLRVVYNGHVPAWFAALTLAVTIGGLAVALWVGVRNYFRDLLPAERGELGSKLKDKMKVPTALIILYAVIGAIAVTVAAQSPRWPGRPSLIAVLPYWVLGVVYPVAVVILVARAVPPARLRTTGPAALSRLRQAAVAFQRDE